jgi:hypothetical protein
VCRDPNHDVLVSSPRQFAGGLLAEALKHASTAVAKRLEILLTLYRHADTPTRSRAVALQDATRITAQHLVDIHNMTQEAARMQGGAAKRRAKCMTCGAPLDDGYCTSPVCPFSEVAKPRMPTGAPNGNDNPDLRCAYNSCAAALAALLEHRPELRTKFEESHVGKKALAAAFGDDIEIEALRGALTSFGQRCHTAAGGSRDSHWGILPRVGNTAEYR